MSPTSPDAPGRWSQRANQLIVAAVIIGCAVALNAVFSQLHWRLDLTSDGIYTLSPVSETTVQNLEQPVDIRVFLSADMPPPYHRLGDQIEELLLEYRAADDANIDFQIVTPDDTDDIEELARGYGIEPVTIGRQTDTSRSYQSVYKGVAFMQGDRQETIADLEVSPQSGIDGFEYEFTRALKNLESQTPRRVGVVTGLGGPADHAGFVERFDTVFQQLYGQLVRLEAVDVAAGDDLQDLEAVVAINLEGDLGEEGLRNLDRFVQQGGNVGWFQSGGVVDDEQRRQMLEHRRQGLAAEPLRRRPTNTDLVDYFRALGLELRADAVIDRSRAIAHGVVPTAEGPVQVSHPALFAIDDIARELPFARHYSTLVIPLPATVRLDERAIGDGVEATSVLRTADTSVRLPTAPDVALYDALIDEIDGEQQGSYTVAAALQGAMPWRPPTPACWSSVAATSSGSIPTWATSGS